MKEKSFDELVELAKTNPTAFDDYKNKFLECQFEQMCNGCPDCMTRCRQFQWRLDQELKKFKDPIARYNAMVSLFWKQVEEFRQAARLNPTSKQADTAATILPFHKKE